MFYIFYIIFLFDVIFISNVVFIFYIVLIIDVVWDSTGCGGNFNLLNEMTKFALSSFKFRFGTAEILVALKICYPQTDRNHSIILYMIYNIIDIIWIIIETSLSRPPKIKMPEKDNIKKWRWYKKVVHTKSNDTIKNKDQYQKWRQHKNEDNIKDTDNIKNKWCHGIWMKQARAELGQAQLPTGIWLYWY